MLGLVLSSLSVNPALWTTKIRTAKICKSTERISSQQGSKQQDIKIQAMMDLHQSRLAEAMEAQNNRRSVRDINGTLEETFTECAPT